MEGYQLEWRNEEGQVISHWDYASNIVYQVEENTEVTVQVALDDVYDKLATLRSDVDSATAFSVTINPVTGHWIINGEETEFPSRGESVPPVIVSGEGGGMAISRGTFQQAYDFATEDHEVDGETVNYSDVIFQWLLEDQDDNNNTIVKLIYHIGDGEFIDALGGRVIGRLNELNIS